MQNTGTYVAKERSKTTTYLAAVTATFRIAFLHVRRKPGALFPVWGADIAARRALLLRASSRTGYSAAHAFFSTMRWSERTQLTDQTGSLYRIPCDYQPPGDFINCISDHCCPRDKTYEGALNSAFFGERRSFAQAIPQPIWQEIEALVELLTVDPALTIDRTRSLQQLFRQYRRLSCPRHGS